MEILQASWLLQRSFFNLLIFYIISESRETFDEESKKEGNSDLIEWN
jgi:hypothetical protein